MNARAFHDVTAHTPYSIRTSGHTLDWDVKPFPFKIYTDAPAVQLPREFAPVATDFIEVAGSRAVATPAPANGPGLALQELAALLYYTAGVTKKKVYPGGGEVLFRAAASTGALYQTEVYVAIGAVEGLAPGLYHFCPGDFTLRRLRDTDVRGALARACRGRRSRPPRGGRRPVGDLLAQHVEVSGPRLPSLVLGQRHDAREPPGHG